MLSMRRWVHDRTIEPTGAGGTTLTDRITIGPRRHLLLMGPVLCRVLQAFFGHRHRRLARYFAKAG